MKIVIDEVNNRAIQDFLRWQGPVKVTIDGEDHAINNAHLVAGPISTMVELTLEKVVCATQKEEKKMLNVDKYREEVEKRMGWAVREGPKNPKPVHLILKEIAFGKGLPYMDGDELVDWLFEKYEPPLLEDGDELNPGDWIMVRDNEDGAWENRQFLAYFDGWFYARKIVSDGWIEKIDHFRQARLPEDGE